MEKYINCKKKLYSTIMEFIEESDEINQQCFEEFCKNMRNFNIEEDYEEMTQFLLMINSICSHHHRTDEFIQKIKKILQHYQKQIKQIIPNDEIFRIFESNKLIVLFLLKNNIINFSEFIYNEMINKFESNCLRYCYFFYPELEQYKGEEEMKFIKEELLQQNPTAFKDFESKRQEGENDSNICLMIRQDLAEEFIQYINRNCISVDSEIAPSLFETNLYLIENKNTSLIEYSAFFGSIQIFQYLLMNKAELTPSLWLYSIHSKNAELIHLLESYKIDPPNLVILNLYEKEDDNSKEVENSYLRCLVESIKCHHNDFSEYIENNLMLDIETESVRAKKEIVLNSLKYYNYSYLQTDMIKEQGFFYLCMYNYNQLVDLFLKEDEKEIQNIIILY